MRSITIGKILGIKIELHYTFVLLLSIAFFLLLIFDPFHILNYGMLFFILFSSVLLHELFHSLVALLKGIRVEKISLLPIGGIAYTQKMPEKPVDELVIALAGPLFNFAIVIIILLIIHLFPNFGMPPSSIFSLESGMNIALLQYPLFALLWVNFILGIFNLFFPALPLDGGRVVRALLATKFGFVKATQIASNASSLLAIFLGLFGLLLGNLFIVIIAVFIFLGAKAEAQTASIKEVLQNLNFRSIIKKPLYAKPEETIQEIFLKMKRARKEYVLIKKQNNFYYLDLEIMAEIDKRLWKKVKAIRVAKKIVPLYSCKNAALALNTILEQDVLALPVIVDNRIIGVVEEPELAKLYKFKKIEAA